MRFTNLHFPSNNHNCEQSSCIVVTNGKYLLVRCFGVCFFSVMLLRTKQHLPCASWCLMIFVRAFLVIPLSIPACRRCVQAKHARKRIYRTTKIL